MGKSLYGNVINPPKNFQTIKVDGSSSVSPESIDSTLTIKGDNRHIKTKIVNSEIVIEHQKLSSTDSGINDKITLSDKIIQGGASDVYITDIEKLEVDNKGHVINIEKAVRRQIRPVGKEDRDSNDPQIVGEIFNYYTANRAFGNNSHAEGSNTTAVGVASHAEGFHTTTGDIDENGNKLEATGAHTEGYYTQAIGQGAHAEGYGDANNLVLANGIGAHAEGVRNKAIGNGAHVEGADNQATASRAHAEGDHTVASGDYSHSEGYQSKALGIGSHAEGSSTADNQYAHSEGIETLSKGKAAHAEGQKTEAAGPYSHAEGNLTIAKLIASHAEGFKSNALKNYSHAEGNQTTADAIGAHAEGFQSKALGNYSHAEGQQTEAQGYFSHSEGRSTKAQGAYSHAGGSNSEAINQGSFAHGLGIIVENDNSVAFGQYNYRPLSSETPRVFQIGMGENENARKDIMYLTPAGNLYASDFKISDTLSLNIVNNNLNESKQALKFSYYYDSKKQKLTFYQGDKQIGEEINIPINAVVNNAEVEEGTSILKLTVNVEDENGNIIQKIIPIDMGKVALDQALLGDTSTITMYQSEDDELHKIRADINSYSIKGGLGTVDDIRHLSITEGERITADNLEDSSIPTRSIQNGAITNEKLSIIDPDTGLGASVNTNNLFNNSITTEKLSSIKNAEAVTTETIRDEAITNAKVDSISFEKIYGNISTNRLEGTITNEQLEGKITSDKLASKFYTDYIDVKLNKQNSEGKGYISYNRRANSEIGENSSNFGYGNLVSGMYSTGLGHSNTVVNRCNSAIGQANNVSAGNNIWKTADGGQGGVCTAIGNSNIIKNGVDENGEILYTSYSCAIGSQNDVSSSYSVALGYKNYILPDVNKSFVGTIAMGYNCTAQGYGAIAEGFTTEAYNTGSHAEGNHTIMKTAGGHVQGKYNIIDESHKLAHIVGNGSGERKDAEGNIIEPEKRSNAHTLDWNGNAWYAGFIETNDKIILRSSSIKEDGTRSDKKFALTIDDEGILSIEEV